jgi:hypothetical protein
MRRSSGPLRLRGRFVQLRFLVQQRERQALLPAKARWLRPEAEVLRSGAPRLRTRSSCRPRSARQAREPGWVREPLLPDPPRFLGAA